jgi:hypothetical protein
MKIFLVGAGGFGLGALAGYFVVFSAWDWARLQAIALFLLWFSSFAVEKGI